MTHTAQLQPRSAASGGSQHPELHKSSCDVGLPKGPFRTKNTTTIAKIVNYYAVVFLLRPPDLQRAPNLPEFAPPAASRSSAGVSSTRGCEFV